MLTIVDEFTRENHLIHVVRRISSWDVPWQLERLMNIHGTPEHIRSDNGSEFIHGEFQAWLKGTGIKTFYNDPRSPWENGFIESFHYRFRAECLDREQLWTLSGARVVIEDQHTRQAYGLDQEVTEDFGRRCLLARRLIERGTRFVQVWSGPQGAKDNWDNHGSISKQLPPIAASVDQPIGALIGDLKSRGLLEDTLLIWTTGFGRTKFAQGGDGRDHNGGSFVTWMAGAGVKPGVAYGQSDEWGYKATIGKTYCYDFHATVLHLLGIDHTRMTFLQNGIDRRLTDVHGHVVHDILS